MTSPTGDEEDRQALARLIGGDEAALNSLMARHAEPLFHYLIRLLHDEIEAGDLAEEAFVRVYQNRQRFDPRRRFTTWLYTIATNLARDRLRWRARYPQVSLDATADTGEPGVGATLPDGGVAPDESAAAAENVGLVRAAVAALPEELRTALVLVEYEDLSHAEAGAVLGCSAKAVEMRLYRARQVLRTRLARLLATP